MVEINFCNYTNAIPIDSRYMTGFTSGPESEEPSEFRFDARKFEKCPPTNIESLLLNSLGKFYQRKLPNKQFKRQAWQVSQEGNFYVLRKISTRPDPRKMPTSKHFSNCQSFDIVSHHNQTLDVVNKLKKQGKFTPGMTLIHFDTHSDLYLQQDCSREDYLRATIANYVNYLIADGSVSEVYWVLPDWTTGNGNGPSFWATEPLKTVLDGPPIKGTNSNPAYILGPSQDLTVYVDTSKKKMFFSQPPDYQSNPDKYKTVAIHKRLTRELPSFTGQSNLLLDIDADYFSNRGHDTAGGGGFNPSDSELSWSLNNFAYGLIKKGINPEIAVVARSPDYCGQEDIAPITKYLSQLFSQPEYIADTIDAYTHQYCGYNYKVNYQLFAAREDISQRISLKPAQIDKLKATLTNLGYQDVIASLDAFIANPNTQTRLDIINKLRKAEQKCP